MSTSSARKLARKQLQDNKKEEAEEDSQKEHEEEEEGDEEIHSRTTSWNPFELVGYIFFTFPLFQLCNSLVTS